MKNERFDRLLEQLKTVSLSYHQYLVLRLAFYETRQFQDVPGYTRALAPFEFDLPTDKQCRDAMHELVCRGFADFVTSQSIKRIKLYLRHNPARGPLCGIPSTGNFDLTLAGFKTWEYLWRLNECWPDAIEAVNFVYRDARTVLIFACDSWSAYSAAADCDFRPIDALVEIGPWRSNWWHLMPKGVVLRCLQPIDT